MKEKKVINIIFEIILEMFVFALVLLLASVLFKGFYISSFWYALLASTLISVFNATIKPILTIVMLPITIMTLGILYPIVNVLVLKITSLILGSNFIIEGFLVPFFIAIFISIMKIILNSLIVEPIKRNNA
ncbi:MAG: phage holin family protein [Bacilli bacterium]